jgi:hypothetical protein
MIIAQLEAISLQITAEQNKMLSHYVALSTIANDYEQAENNILGAMQGATGAASRGSLWTNLNTNIYKAVHHDDSDFSWFKEGSFQRFLQELYEAGLISYPFLLQLLKAYLSKDPQAQADAIKGLIEALKKEGNADLLALLPRYLSNEGFIALYEALRTGDAKGNPVIQAILDQYGNTLTPEEIEAHYNNNVNELHNVYKEGDFIENQDEWGNIQYGKDTNYPGVDSFANQSSMRNSGCEVIAVANALHNMGYDLSEAEMAQLISDFEKDGIVMNGVIGTSPMALYDYMVEHGYNADYTTSTSPTDINNFGNNYDTFIVTGYNNQNDVTQAVHTVCITKNPDGSFTVHNGYNQTNGTWGEAGPFSSLDEAVGHIVQNGDPEPIMITGVGNANNTVQVDNKI